MGSGDLKGEFTLIYLRPITKRGGAGIEFISKFVEGAVDCQQKLK